MKDQRANRQPGTWILSRLDPLAGLARAPRAGTPAAFALGVGTAIAIFLSKWVLDAISGAPLPPFVSAYPAVVMAAALGGPRTGLVVTGASIAMAAFSWMPYPISAWVTGRAAALSIIVYAVTAGFLAVFVGSARQALDRAIDERRAQANAAGESQHRIKNLLAVVQAIARKVAHEADTKAAMLEGLDNRLAALNAAQSMLVQRDWFDVPLADIVAAAVAPFQPDPRFQLQAGPEVLVPARHASGLTLALFELCTNAAKYGALQGAGGEVHLSWRLDGAAVVLEWRETLAARVAPLPPGGFGTLLIRAALARERDTATDYRIEETVVTAQFRWPYTPAP